MFAHWVNDFTYFIPEQDLIAVSEIGGPLRAGRFNLRRQPSEEPQSFCNTCLSILEEFRR